MATQHGQAGRSTRQMEARRGLRREGILLLILVVGAAFLLLIPRIGKLGGIVGIAGLLIALAVFKGIMAELERSGSKAKREERWAGRGARAEEKMADIFSALSDDFLVFHDVASGHGNIDHVLLSRTKGIFVIETKSHHGNVTVSGNELLLNGHPTEKNFINQTLSNCLWLKEWVKQNMQVDAWVIGVIVFTNAYVEVRQPIHGIHIINKGFLQRFLERQRDNPKAGRLWERRGDAEMLLAGQSPA